MTKVLTVLGYIAGVIFAVLVESLSVLFIGEVVADIDLEYREALGIGLFVYVLSHGVAGITARKVLD